MSSHWDGTRKSGRNGKKENCHEVYERRTRWRRINFKKRQKLTVIYQLCCWCTRRDLWATMTMVILLNWLKLKTFSRQCLKFSTKVQETNAIRIQSIVIFIVDEARNCHWLAKSSILCWYNWNKFSYPRFSIRRIILLKLYCLSLSMRKWKLMEIPGRSEENMAIPCLIKSKQFVLQEKSFNLCIGT